MHSQVITYVHYITLHYKPLVVPGGIRSLKNKTKSKTPTWGNHKHTHTHTHTLKQHLAVAPCGQHARSKAQLESARRTLNCSGTSMPAPKRTPL